MIRALPIGLVTLALLAGCPTSPKKEDEPSAAVGTPGMDSTLPPPAGRSAPATAPRGTAEARGPVLRPLPPGVTARAEVQRILRQSFDWLNDGEEDKARVELEQATLLEPDNKQVSCLLRGITVDPQVALGRDSTPYTVNRGEILSNIARRFLGDLCEFYILARYNDIKVPKRLAAGQTIRVPGKVAVAPPPPSPVYKPPVVTPAPKAVEPPKLVEPPKAVEAAKPVETKPAAAPAVDPTVRANEINRRYGGGRAALTRQDLTTAIREFDVVLGMDPGHNGARVYRQQALELQEKLRGLPPK